MNRTVNILMLVLLMAIGMNIWAQGKKSASSTAASKHILVPTVYLGHTDNKGGLIKKNEFDDLLKQGLTSKDSLGNTYRVVGFEFTYAERKVYEDSVGNLIQVTDLSTQYCNGDTVTADISASIYDRTKAGDTVYFDRISVVHYQKSATSSQSDNDGIGARSMRFVITK